MGSRQKKSTTLSCTIELPEDFRRDDVLAFHQRDALRVAKRVEAETLHKGLVWAGLPACLTVRFRDRYAEVELAIVRQGQRSTEIQVMGKYHIIVGQRPGHDRYISGAWIADRGPVHYLPTLFSHDWNPFH